MLKYNEYISIYLLIKRHYVFGWILIGNYKSIIKRYRYAEIKTDYCIFRIIIFY